MGQMRHQRKLIFHFHKPSLITKRKNSSEDSSTLSQERYVKDNCSYYALKNVYLVIEAAGIY